MKTLFNMIRKDLNRLIKQNNLNINTSDIICINEQTPEICLAAIEETGLAIRYIKEQTPYLCMEAVK